MNKKPTRRLERNILDGNRISEEDAYELYEWDVIDLARAADGRRKIAVPGEIVGFIIDRIINFTNICEAKCRFCAFHARAEQVDPFELSIDDIMQKVGELKEMGGSQVMLQGGLHPDYTIDRYTQMVKRIKETCPDIFVHSFSPAELIHIAKKNDLDLVDVVSTLHDAGLDSVPGASDLLVDRVRHHACPNKMSVDEWKTVMEALAHRGMKSSATMTFGMGETMEEQIRHLSVVRDVQDRTGIIRAFIPWSFSPAKTGMADTEPATGMEYLKLVAISRIFLDNITHIQAGWLTEGLKLAQLALTMGANDMGGILMEETVVKATGVNTKANVDEFVRIIKNAGKIPVLRDSAYQVIQRYE